MSLELIASNTSPDLKEVPAAPGYQQWLETGYISFDELDRLQDESDVRIPPREELRDVSETFRELTQQWHSQRKPVSSPAAWLTPAYEQIIALGVVALPLILQELRSHPDHWFTALRRITGRDPVPPQAAGDIHAMAEAWLQWGQRQGVII